MSLTIFRQALLPVMVITFNFSFAQIVTTLPAPQHEVSKQIIQTPLAPTPIGPYSQGVTSGTTTFISGQVGKDPVTGELVTSDIQKETRRVMENIKGILSAAGLDFTNVVKTTIYLTDMKNFTAMNEVYGSYFTGEYPARETVQVSALPLGVNIEISMIAVR